MVNIIHCPLEIFIWEIFPYQFCKVFQTLALILTVWNIIISRLQDISPYLKWKLRKVEKRVNVISGDVVHQEEERRKAPSAWVAGDLGGDNDKGRWRMRWEQRMEIVRMQDKQIEAEQRLWFVETSSKRLKRLALVSMCLRTQTAKMDWLDRGERQFVKRAQRPSCKSTIDPSFSELVK